MRWSKSWLARMVSSRPSSMAEARSARVCGRICLCSAPCHGLPLRSSSVAPSLSLPVRPPPLASRPSLHAPPVPPAV
eukprot:scaffold37381_cov33-Tisochrysis_lutea.AAC.4